MRSLLPHRNRQLACHALLLAVCLVGYWPLTLGVFSVKNDAIHYFLPARYNISCAIRSGEWPLWSPFFYTGFPLHGDMQSGAWNPLVWVLSLFSRYNLTVLHIETLLYIYLAGIGMFRLARQVTSHTGTRLFVALSYMLSGYLFGSAQFTNWMASAAFLPFVLDSYTDLLRTRTTGSAVRTALSCWMLLVCGYPADFLYTSYLLLALLAVVWVHHRNRLSREAVRRYAVSHLVLIALFIGLALPALLSYIQMLPYYGRGGGASLQDALVNSYEPRNLVSLLDPWPTWTAGFRTITDLSSRNLFVGVLPLLFLPFAFGNRMRKRAWLLLGILLISLLFAFGDGFGLRRVAYSWLPGMASFRHPAHFRLYVIVALLLLSASGFDHLRRKSTASFRKSVLAGLVACLVIMVLGGAGASGASLPAMSRAALKSWVVNVSMGNALVVGLACQALFLLVVFLYARRRAWSPDRLLWLHVANLLFFNALLPVTLVGKTNPSVVNGIIRARAGVTSGPSFDSTLSVNSRDALAHYETAGRLGFYSGRITLLPTVYNPSALRTFRDFLQSPFLYKTVLNRKPAYLSGLAPMTDTDRPIGIDSCLLSYVANVPLPDTTCLTKGNVRLLKSGFLFFTISVDAPASTALNLTQNCYPNWEARIDGQDVPIRTTNLAFMSVRVPAGVHVVEWRYRPRAVMASIPVSIAVLVLSLFLLVRKRRRIH